MQLLGALAWVQLTEAGRHTYAAQDARGVRGKRGARLSKRPQRAQLQVARSPHVVEYDIRPQGVPQQRIHGEVTTARVCSAGRSPGLGC